MGLFADNIKKSAIQGTGIFSWPKAIATGSYGGVKVKPTVTHTMDPEQMRNMQMLVGVGILVLIINTMK